MEKAIKINIPEGYIDAVFDKGTNEIKFIKTLKLGDKVTIDGIEGYVLEVDNAGEPTVLCSEILGDMTWNDAMQKANQGLWHLPADEEFKKYYKIIRELDSDWYGYWTSTEYNPLYARCVYTSNCNVGNVTKTYSYYVRAFAYVSKMGKKQDNKPRSWEEYREQVRNTPCFAISVAEEGRAIKRNRGGNPFVNEFNNKEEAKAVITLCKLIQLRDAWWGDWKPNWEDTNKKFTIFCDRDILVRGTNYSYQRVLAFPTQEMCIDFFETFHDLIEGAKPLL